MFTYDNNKLVCHKGNTLPPSEIPMTRVEVGTLWNALIDMDTNNIPDMVYGRTKEVEEKLEEFQRSWRRDKRIRPERQLIRAQGLHEVCRDLAGYTWYVTCVARDLDGKDLFQLQALGEKSIAINTVCGWESALAELHVLATS